MVRLMPNFDKFELEAFKSAGHSKWKVFKWAVALLSGRFKQGKNLLERSDGSMCCVGVLCKISGVARTVSEEGYVYYTHEGHTTAIWIAPHELLGGKLVDPDDNYPEFGRKNDLYDVSFREIGLFLLRSLFPIRKEKDARYEQR